MRIHIAFALIAISLCIMACASVQPPMVFQPTANGVVSYFVNGMPLGAIDDSSTSILLSLETTELARTRYMRLWVLVRSKDSAPFLLDPATAFALLTEGYPDLVPAKPSTILASIENEKAASLIAHALGAALQGMTVRDTKNHILHG